MTWKNEKNQKHYLWYSAFTWRYLSGAFIQIRSAPGRNSAPAGINLIPYAASVVVNGKVQISEIIENMLVFLPFPPLHLSLLSGQRNPEPHSPCIGTEPVF